ncbi:Uncharacterised protein [Yersinia mollaretii]|uniref:hypothetical protein n=1 Tax=Yersinia mollaretii TaxID=33060 RepID=UPI0005DE56A2|nr:hypothetical protein [Yersinia mollaretii]CNK68624.1 Uncharacterised protein [Yersinia mollaretii]
MNNLEELKAKKPENLKSRSSVLADYVTDDNTGGYFVVECENCGEVFPSQKLGGGGAIADTGDYDDAYCPHCNAVDPDECYNAGLVWNIQQAKINALIAQLEAAQKLISEDGKLQYIRRLEARAEKAEAELSAANEKLNKPVVFPDPAAHLIWSMGGSAPDDYYEITELSHDKDDTCFDGSPRCPVYTSWEVIKAIKAAGFTVEGE